MEAECFSCLKRLQCLTEESKDICDIIYKKVLLRRIEKEKKENVVRFRRGLLPLGGGRLWHTQR